MKAVLDACVLYPTLTRGLLLDAAAAGVFTPIWSARITGEWINAASRDTPIELVRAEAALLADRWPGAEVAVPEGADTGLSLPDPDDVHVLAAAIAAGAPVIITLNQKDFPPRVLAGHGVTPSHPDPFLLAALDEAPDQMLDAIRDRLAPFLAEGHAHRAILKRARLPRLGKAVASLL